jgi:hypothetical protein
VASIVRILFVPSITGSPEFLFKETANLAIWSTIETGIGITAVCLVTLRPLITLWLKGARNSIVKIHGDSGGKMSVTTAGSVPRDIEMDSYSPHQRKDMASFAEVEFRQFDSPKL